MGTASIKVMTPITACALTSPASAVARGGGAHVQRVGRCGADLPTWLEVVKHAEFVDDVDGAWIVISESFVDVAVEDDALICGQSCLHQLLI